MELYRVGQVVARNEVHKIRPLHIHQPRPRLLVSSKPAPLKELSQEGVEKLISRPDSLFVFNDASIDYKHLLQGFDFLEAKFFVRVISRHALNSFFKPLEFSECLQDLVHNRYKVESHAFQSVEIEFGDGSIFFSLKTCWWLNIAGLNSVHFYILELLFQAIDEICINFS